MLEGRAFAYFTAYASEAREVVRGYTFTAYGKGYSSTIETIVGVDPDGSICGIKIVDQKETPGLGAKVQEVSSQNTLWAVIAGNARRRGRNEALVPAAVRRARGATTCWSSRARAKTASSPSPERPSARRPSTQSVKRGLTMLVSIVGAAEAGGDDRWVPPADTLAGRGRRGMSAFRRTDEGHLQGEPGLPAGAGPLPRAGRVDVGRERARHGRGRDVCSPGFEHRRLAHRARSIPAKVRIPCFIVVIASFVTIVELVMGAYLPELSKSLGIFIPLIVVNCIILGRAEAFASKNGLWPFDNGRHRHGARLHVRPRAHRRRIREILGDGKLMGYMVFGPDFQPVLIMILAPGAFITIGLLMGYFNLLDAKMKRRAEAATAAGSKARGGR